MYNYDTAEPMTALTILPDLELLANAVNAAGSSLIITDQRLPDHPIIFCNPAFERLTGYSTEEIIGRNCRFLQANNADQYGIKEVRQAIASARGCMVPVLNYRKDGKPFWNELLISPVPGEDGRISHFIGIQNDITHRMTGRNADTDLRSLAAHELRSPLTTIKGTLQLLQQRGLHVDTRFVQKSLDAALRAVNRLEQFGKDLLN